MEAEFWIKVWEEEKTGFHRQEYHDKLLHYFPQLSPEKGQRVLVPLCGKSKDILWLHNMNLYVHGIELSHQAIELFFKENNLPSPRKTKDSDFTHYTHENIILSCGNFFKLNENDTYDFIYDRASLVALPPSMRQDYAQVIKRSLKEGGRYLLIVYEYNSEELTPPPFSIGPNEIHRLYERDFKITLEEVSEKVKEGTKLSSLPFFKQKVYLLEKRKTPNL